MCAAVFALCGLWLGDERRVWVEVAGEDSGVCCRGADELDECLSQEIC